MQQVNAVVLASLAAALTMLGLRLLSHSGDSELAPAMALGSAFSAEGLRDRRLPPSRIAIDGGRRPAQRPPEPGATPAVEGRRRSHDAADATRAAADLVAGTERRRALLERGRGAPVNGFEAPEDDEASESVLAARTGAVPRAASAHDTNPPPADPNQRHTFDFVDQPAPKDAGSPDVLLKIPFKGTVDAEIGGGSIQADGLVTRGGDVEFPDDAQLSFPVGGNVNSSAGTISFELQPQWAGADETNNSLVQIRNEHVWENTLEIVKNYAALRFIIIDSVGVERNVNIPIGDWPPNEPQRITATWGDAAMALYINGELAGQSTLANSLNFSETTPIHIGSDFPDASYVGAGGKIRDFTVYARALGPDEITR